MSSKLRIGALVLTISILAACSVRFDDLPTAQNARITSGGCLSGISETADEYLNGEAKPETIRKASSCLIEALEEFDFVNRGEGFKPGELVSFLNRKVFGEPRISRNLTKELMKIKVLFVGGREDYVLNMDFIKLISFIRFIEEHALANLPYIKIYRGEVSASEEENLTLDKLEEAKVQLRRTAYALAAWIRGSQVTYDFGSLEQLIRELRSLLNFKVSSSQDSIDTWVELIRVYKLMTVSGSEKEIEPTYWVSLLGGMAELYGLRMDADYFLKRKALYISEGFAALNKSAEKTFAILEGAINNQERKTLSYHLIGRLLNSLAKLDYIPGSIRVETSLLPMVKRIGSVAFRSPREKFENLVRPDGAVSAEGIGLQNLQQMRLEFSNWSQTQVSLLQIKGFAESRNLLGDYKDLTILAEKSGIQVHGSVKYLLAAVPLRFRMQDEAYRVLMVNLSDGSQHRDFYSLTYSNAARIASRLLVRLAAEAESRYQSLIGITAEEAEAIYKHILPLGIDLKLFSSSEDGLGFKVFKEGNLFTFSGNGIQKGSGAQSLLTLGEVSQQVSLIYSGFQFQSQMHKILESLPQGNKCKVGEMYRTSCLKLLVQTQWEKLIWNFPRLKSSFQDIPTHERNRFFETLWDMSADACQGRDLLKSSAVLKFATLLHYIEAVFVTYDSDKNEVLSGQEVMAAFPRFQLVLDDEVYERENERKSIGILKSIFAFLVSEGRLPSGLVDKSTLAWWDLWYFDSDPHQFIRNPKSSVVPMSITRQQLADVFQFLHSSDDTICH